MTKILLTQENFQNIKAGVEVFSDHLKQAFPDLDTIDIRKAAKFGMFEFFWPLKQPMRALAVQQYLLKNIEKIKPDIIFANGEFAWHLNKEKVKIPVVAINHGGWKHFAEHGLPKNTLNYYRTKYIYSYFENKSFANADVIVCNSEYTKNLMPAAYKSKSKVIYNGINTQMFKQLDQSKCREKLGLPSDQKFILFGSSPSYCKGLDIVQKISKQLKDILFVYLTYPKLGIAQDNVMCFDTVSHKRLCEFYNAADIILFPSRFEGFGYVPLEALACNTPVITNKVGIFSDFKDVDIPNCFVLDDYNVDKYITAIKAIFGKIEKQDSRMFVEENFSTKLFIEKYQSLAGFLSGKN